MDEDKLKFIGREAAFLTKTTETNVYKHLFTDNKKAIIRSNFFKEIVETNDYFPNELHLDKYKKPSMRKASIVAPEIMYNDRLKQLIEKEDKAPQIDLNLSRKVI